MKQFLRISALAIIGIIILAAIITSTTVKPNTSSEVWDEQMTIGDLNAKNHFIIYSDLVCPYCIAFENAIVEHEEEFQQYLAENDILLEIRLSDFLYEYGQSQPVHSRYAAVATYCARDEGKFWDYYNLAVTKVWQDFFATSGKAGATAMNSLDKTYWTDIGKTVGLGESFVSCVANDTPLPEITETSKRMQKLISGMPYFKFNDYTNSGFDLSWGWEYVLMYFQAGLNS